MTTRDELTAWLRPLVRPTELLILDLHTPRPTGWHVPPDGPLQCEHCAGLCHSYSGIGCDVPDAEYPCDTVRVIAEAYGWSGA